MIMDLPQYLIKNEIEIFAPLPASVCIIDEVREVGQEDRSDRTDNEDEELCIICMTNLAVGNLCCCCFITLQNTVLLPCGHVSTSAQHSRCQGGYCNSCAKLLYKQISKRKCPLCRQVAYLQNPTSLQSISQVASIKTPSTKMYQNYRVYSVEKDCFVCWYITYNSRGIVGTAFLSILKWISRVYRRQKSINMRTPTASILQMHINVKTSLC